MTMTIDDTTEPSSPPQADPAAGGTGAAGNGRAGTAPLFARQLAWLAEHVKTPPELARTILRDLAIAEPLAAHLRHILLCAGCLPLMLAIWTCWLAMLLCHDAHLLARRAWRHAAERLFLPELPRAVRRFFLYFLIGMIIGHIIVLFSGCLPATAHAGDTATLPAPDGPGGMGWILAGLFALATGSLALKQLFRRDPPLRAEFVTRTEYTRDREQWEARDARLTALTDKLFAKSETLSGDLKAAAAQVEKLDESLARLTYKIDQLLIARK